MEMVIFLIFINRSDGLTDESVQFAPIRYVDYHNNKKIFDFDKPPRITIPHIYVCNYGTILRIHEIDISFDV